MASDQIVAAKRRERACALCSGQAQSRRCQRGGTIAGSGRIARRCRTSNQCREGDWHGRPPERLHSGAMDGWHEKDVIDDATTSEADWLHGDFEEQRPPDDREWDAALQPQAGDTEGPRQAVGPAEDGWRVWSGSLGKAHLPGVPREGAGRSPNEAWGHQMTFQPVWKRRARGQGVHEGHDREWPHTLSGQALLFIGKGGDIFLFQIGRSDHPLFSSVAGI